MSKLIVKPNHVKRMAAIINAELLRIAPESATSTTLNVLRHSGIGNSEMRTMLWWRCINHSGLASIRLHREIIKYATLRDIDAALAAITRTVKNRSVHYLNLGW